MTASHDRGVSHFNVLAFQRFNDSTLARWVCLLIAALTLLCYWPVRSHQFVSFDDEHYLFDSGYVSKGLTWSSMTWALQTGYFSNWHPLTWLSYMLDAQIYGMSPGGFHVTNLLFHISNSLLLFLLLKSMTQRLWPSALVAALFAWHPLHVESVAWVSERKDVLSTFFFLLTLFSYFRYVKEREGSQPVPNKASSYYLLSLLFFMLALASKQMVVTLPCVLLLLDLWPLQRISLNSSRRELASSALLLVREKLPFLILAFAASAVAFAVQKASGSVSSIEAIPMRLRLANSLFWLWFIGTLVPVIGLIQVGSQARADRYMYIPAIGLCITLIWGVDAFCRSWPRRFHVLAIPTVVGLAALVVCTRVQVGYWHDTEKLFRHAIAAVPGNYLAYNGLGKALDELGRKEDAIRAWNEVLRLVPDEPAAQYNLGTSLLAEGKGAEALPHLQAAVKGTPNNANARENLGNVYLKMDKLAEATTQYASAAALAPGNAVFLQVLGTVLLKQSRWSDAATVLTEALKLDPKSADANRNLGIARINQGKRAEAIRLFSEAVRLQPDSSDIRFNLGLALLEDNQPGRAAEQFAECLRLNPNETRSHYRLAVTLSQQHQVKDAIFHYHEALRLTPDFPDAMNELARLLACAPEAEVREGAEAVRLAEKACAMTNNQQADMLTTLAAAYAEAGRFQDAIATAQRARDLAASNGQNALAAKAGELLALCQSGRPLRE